MAVGIGVAAHVVGHILELLLHGGHIGRHLHGQQRRGLALAADDIEQCLVLHIERDEQGVGKRLDFGKHDGASGLDDDNHGFPAHLFPRVGHHHHIVAVVGGDGLVLEAAVGGLLHRVATGNADGTGTSGLVIVVLQAEGHIAVAALPHVGGAVAHAGAGFLDEADGEVGLLGLVDHLEILGHQSGVDGLNGVLLGDASPHARDGREMALGHPHLLLFLYGQHAVGVVLEHHHRLELGLVTLLHELRIANDALGLGRVEVGILEQAHTEHIEQQAAGTLLEPLTGALLAKFLAPHLVSLEHRPNLVVAAKLVDAGLQDLVMPLHLIEMLHAPWLSAHRTVEHLHVLGDAPVGAYHTLEMGILTKLLLDHPFAEATTHVLARRVLVPEDAVDGHHGRGHLRATLETERALGERTFVHGQVVSGIDGILARSEVGVAAALLRAIAIPVLHHGVDTPVAPPLRLGGGLEPVAVGPGQIGGELRVLAEGAAEAEPARFGGDIDLRRQGGGDAQGAVFGSGYLAETAHELRVEGGGQAERRGPLRDLPSRTGVELRGGLGLMPRVGTGVGGDAMVESLDKRLHVVVPLGGHGRTLHTGHQHSTQMVVAEELLLVVGQVGGFCPTLLKRLSTIGRGAEAHPRHHGHRLVATVEHQSGNLLDGEFGSQVGGTLLRTDTPVFVGIERVVVVEVFEGIAVDGKDLDA